MISANTPDQGGLKHPKGFFKNGVGIWFFRGLLQLIGKLDFKKIFRL